MQKYYKNLLISQQKNLSQKLTKVMLIITSSSLRCIKAQESQLVADNYATISGYDVNRMYTAAINSTIITVPQASTIACMYACSVTKSCAFSVLNKANMTCSTYTAAARTSVYASANSTIYQRSVNGFKKILKKLNFFSQD
jgi:predicted ribonuclease YlaK